MAQSTSLWQRACDSLRYRICDGWRRLHPRRLPGNRHARVLLPLDYPPSRAAVSRWGTNQPPIPALVTLFGAGAQAQARMLDGLRRFSPDLARIGRRYTRRGAAVPGWLGGAMTPIDAALLYVFLRDYRPATYLEIGSGVSTSFARRAITDGGLATRIVSIDPAPRAAINDICDEIVRDGLETVDLTVFDRLLPGDIVFLDGSHRSFMNSDVTVFMIDVLPRLKPGVIVHIHDIFLPDDYPDSFKTWYWNEQYLVATYLMGHRHRIEVLMPSHYISGQTGFAAILAAPPVDLGPRNDGWRQGGSLWFTHTAPFDPA
ncbi:MAG TPA: class I SAM-dependent methyltransferase [Stellaceae bacterium]|nr:class I SAM-dependent methyltransferase [Stellaceae bacterium]